MVWQLNKEILKTVRTFILHGKNDFASNKESKNLDTDLKIMLLDCQNYFVGRSSMMSNTAKNVDILATSST